MVRVRLLSRDRDAGMYTYTHTCVGGRSSKHGKQVEFVPTKTVQFSCINQQKAR
eukprot:m.3383 g.3383  ORF g.3383 m.3383 type:complete len:54 (-) comp680_c0_seq1:81-242(-)